MYKLDDKTMYYIDKNIREKLKMSYEEYDKLDFDEQQELWAKYRKKHRKKEDEDKLIPVMIGTGELATFQYVKKGEEVMLYDGTIVRAGITPEEERMEIDDALDDIIFSKPVAFVKKLKRRIKSRF